MQPEAEPELEKSDASSPVTVSLNAMEYVSVREATTVAGAATQDAVGATVSMEMVALSSVEPGPAVDVADEFTDKAASRRPIEETSDVQVTSTL